MASRADQGGKASGFTALFVRRPILAIVVNLLIVIAGLAAIFGVEIRELPDVDRPVITVTTDFDGAAPETIDREVTGVIEGAMGRISGVADISSRSTFGRSRVTVEFTEATDLNVAASDARDSLGRVLGQLPDDADEPRIVKADANSEPVMRLGVTSSTLSVEALTDYVENNIEDRLISAPGVADVAIYGGRDRIFRIDVDQLALASRGLNVADVRDALATVAFDSPAGSLNATNQSLVVRTTATVNTPEAFGAIMLDDADPALRRGDGDARAEVRHLDPALERRGRPRHRHHPPGAEQHPRNLARASAPSSTSSSRRCPEGVRLFVTGDDAVFIRGAIDEVLRSLLLAVAIVVAVIYLFLRDWRATLIPALTIPVALIGTLAAIYIVGYSVNILTLLALVLATGLVVDDAIVVLENIVRRQAQGLGPRAAAVLGTEQVFFAGHRHHDDARRRLPAALLPPRPERRALPRVRRDPRPVGRDLRLRRPVALPDDGLADAPRRRDPRARRARPSRPPLPPPPPRRARGAVGRRHARPRLRRHRLADVRLDRAGADPARGPGDGDAAGQRPAGRQPRLHRRQDARDRGRHRLLRASGEIVGTFSIAGTSGDNSGFMIFTLAPWGERARDQQAIVDDVTRAASRVVGLRSFAMQPNSLGIRGAGQGLQFALLGSNFDSLDTASKALVKAMEADPRYRQVRVSYETTQPQLFIAVDRARASDLGIDIDGLGEALQSVLDGRSVGSVFVDDRSYDIDITSTTNPVRDPTDLENLFLRTGSGEMVPMSTVVTLEERPVAPELARESQMRAISISVTLADGVGLADAYAGAEAMAEPLLPPGARIIPRAETATLDETSSGLFVTFGFAIVVVLLVLAAQFESFTSALIVMATVPFGLGCAIVAMVLAGVSLNVYSQIGLVLLVGIIAKNGILVVEFANQLRDHGASVREAIEEACHIRLRPVMMTMIATIAGGVPLLVSHGAGAEARAALGWVIVGGLGLACLLTLFLTPVAYLLLAGFAKPRAEDTRRLEDELARSVEAT